jgi:glycosyltransferase involved in cell wall biosynthesis
MTSQDKPLVSIGLPLYNAGEQTRDILDNLLAQDYRHFELIISDNASTDHTWTICQEYAERDSRIRLYKNDRNHGYIYNFERVFELATGEFFMWAAHDDRWEPQFISACVEELTKHPEAALCYTDQLFIYQQTNAERAVRYSVNLQVSAWRRVVTLLVKKTNVIIYGLFRRQLIEKAFPYPRVPSVDIAFLVRVLLLGQAVHVPDILYKRSVGPAIDFRHRMRLIRPDSDLPPSFVIVLESLFTLLGYAWRSSEPLIGKCMMSLAILRYIFFTFGIQFLPPPVHPAARSLKRRLLG